MRTRERHPSDLNWTQRQYSFPPLQLCRVYGKPSNRSCNEPFVLRQYSIGPKSYAARTQKNFIRNEFTDCSTRTRKVKQLTQVNLNVLLFFFLHCSRTRFLLVYRLAMLEQLPQGTRAAAIHLQRVVVHAFDDAQLGDAFVGTSACFAAEKWGKACCSTRLC